jgi:hypothetical protein
MAPTTAVDTRAGSEVWEKKSREREEKRKGGQETNEFTGERKITEGSRAEKFNRT